AVAPIARAAGGVPRRRSRPRGEGPHRRAAALAPHALRALGRSGRTELAADHPRQLVGERPATAFLSTTSAILAAARSSSGYLRGCPRPRRLGGGSLRG